MFVDHLQLLFSKSTGASLTYFRYGYRGRECRANVYLLPTGEVVYFIASVVVLFNYEERTQRHYLGHTDCVKWWDFCCSPTACFVVPGESHHRVTNRSLSLLPNISLAIHPDKIRIATGQIAGVDKDGRVRHDQYLLLIMSYFPSL